MRGHVNFTDFRLQELHMPFSEGKQSFLKRKIERITPNAWFPYDRIDRRTTVAAIVVIRMETIHSAIVSHSLRSSRLRSQR